MDVKDYGVTQALVKTGSFRAVKYLSPALVVRATRRTYKRKIRKGDPVTVLLSFSRPNYRERKFVAVCKEVGEPFPVKKIQLQPFPKRKK